MESRAVSIYHKRNNQVNELTDGKATNRISYVTLSNIWGAVYFGGRNSFYFKILSNFWGHFITRLRWVRYFSAVEKIESYFCNCMYSGCSTGDGCEVRMLVFASFLFSKFVFN